MAAAAFNNANPIARFMACAGNCATTDNAFLATLGGDGMIMVNADHWLILVMPNALRTVDVAGTTFYLVPMSLLNFLFVTAVLFTAAADAVSIPFFILPITVSGLLVLVEMINGGMSDAVCTGWSQVRDCILVAAASLPVATRTLTDFELRSTPLSSCWLASLTPALIRGSADSNAVVADLLHILPDSFKSVAVGAGANRVFSPMPMLQAAISMILPADVDPASPDVLKAVMAASYMANTNADPPLNYFVEYGDIMSELTRRKQPTEEGRFRFIFDRHFCDLYPVLLYKPFSL